MKKILLLEDDEALSTGIVMAMSRENYEFTQCFTISETREVLKGQIFDLIILDINLPDGSGLELCHKIRENNKTPIILLTARGTELDIVAGLETGADDYITKPFSLMVLRARVNALFRRLEPEGKTSEYQTGPFIFHFTAMEFLKNNTSIDLSKTEQKLLYLFISNPNQILSRTRMMEYVWPDGTEYVEDNALSVTIRRLRDKLEDNPSRPEYIKTMYGLGYMWVPRL